MHSQYVIPIRCRHNEDSKQKIIVPNLEEREKEFDIVTHMHQ